MVFGLVVLLQTVATAQILQILCMEAVVAAAVHMGRVLWVAVAEMEAFQVVEAAVEVEQTLAAL